MGSTVLAPTFLTFSTFHPSEIRTSDPGLLYCSLCWFLFSYSLSVSSLLLPAYLSAVISFMRASPICADRQLQLWWTGGVGLGCLGTTASVSRNTTVLI